MSVFWKWSQNTIRSLTSVQCMSQNGTNLQNLASNFISQNSNFMLQPHSIFGQGLLGSLRGKKIKTGGTTRNQTGRTKGKKRGFKVYDGQRVPANTVLITQIRLKVLPGWNASFSSTGKFNILSNCNGRVMITTEKCDLDFKANEHLRNFDDAFPEHSRLKPNFRLYAHVIPDEKHRYFKLIEQI